MGDGQLTGYLETDLEELSGTLTVSGDWVAKKYDGPYEVVSIPYDEQKFDTEGMMMTEDLVVLPIPYYETSNLSDGYTAYIGV